VIVAFDFFTVRAADFPALVSFFVIAHGRTGFCTSTLLVIRRPSGWYNNRGKPFPRPVRVRYAILDHDSKFDADVLAFLKPTGLRPRRTSVQDPWQNGTAERWAGNCRREILGHVIA
jgi:hypothetical protein